MGKYKKNPRYNVLSIRISDEELEALASVSHNANKSISDLMREALYQIVPPPMSCYDRGGKSV
jgi:ribbon-helix-helix CopG family protein